MRIYFLILSIICCSHSFSHGQPKRIKVNTDSLAIYNLMERVKNKTDQKNVDSLLNFSIQEKYGSFQDTMQNCLRKLFTPKDKSKYMVSALGKIKTRNFDYEISELVKDVHSFDAYTPGSLYQAINSSGGEMSMTKVDDICRRPLLSTEEVKYISLKNSLWNLRFNIQPIKTVNSCLEYYGFTMFSLNELELNNAGANLIIDMLKKVSENRNLLIELTPSLRSFVISLDRIRALGDFYSRSLDIGQKGSNRYKINSYIFDILKAQNSPHALAVLVDFTRCNDPEIAAGALNISFSKLSNTSYFPKSFNIPKDKQISALVFKKIEDIKVDYSNIYMFSANFMNLLNYRYFMWDSKGPIYDDPERTNVNYIEVNARYEAAAKSSLNSLGKRFDFKASFFADSLEKYKSETHIPNYDNNFFSFQALFQYLKNSVRKSFQEEGFSANISDSTATLIVGKEFDKKALLAYSLLLGREKFGIALPKITFENIDDVFEHISSTYKKGDVITSEVKNSLFGNKIAQIQTPVDFIDRPKILQRKYSFVEGSYYEKIKFFDRNNKERILEWYGILPVSWLLPLSANPRLLDFTDYSLAIHEFAQISKQTEFARSEIDYIRIDPINALSYLFNAASSTHASWQDLKEALILNPFSFYGSQVFNNFIKNQYSLKNQYSSEPFDPKKSSTSVSDEAVSKMLLEGFPGGAGYFWGSYTSVDSADYENKKNLYLQPLLNLISIKAYKKINELLLNYNTNEVKETNDCEFVDIFCHLDLITNENRDRTAAITNGRKNINQLIEYEKFLVSWDLTDFIVNEHSAVYMRQLLISPDYKKFFGTYEMVSGDKIRYVNLEGELNELPEIIKLLLKKDPKFLNSYHLDLSGASMGANKKIAQAVNTAYNENYGVNSFQQLLKITGYDFINPWSLGFNPKGPILSTGEGKVITSELIYLNKIADWAIGGKLEKNNQPTPSFISGSKSFWNEAVKYVENQAIANFEQRKAAANAHKDDKNIGIGIVSRHNGGGTALYFEVGYKGFNLKLSSETDFKDLTASISPSAYKMFPLSFNLSELFIKSKSAQSTSTNNLKTIYSDSKLQFNDIPTLSVASSNINELRLNSIKISNKEMISKLPTNWMQISPIIGGGPWANSQEANGNRGWLINLITLASPKLSEAELKELFTAVKSGFFPEKLVEILVTKRNEALEDSNIASGDWLQTEVSEEGLIPDEVNRKKQTEKEYIDDVNKQNNAAFEAETTNKQNELGTKAIFEDGLPSAKITYSRDFKNIMWTYTYLLKDGTTITRNDISPVYFAFVDLIKKDPKGHVLEKLASIALGEVTAIPDRKNPVRRSDYKKIKESARLRNELQKMSEVFQNEIRDFVVKAFKNYRDKQKSWQDANDKDTNGVIIPFTPEASSAVFLNLFPSNYEMQRRRNQKIIDMLTIQRNSPDIRQINSGEVIIKYPGL